MSRGLLSLAGIAGFLLTGCALNYNRRFDSSWRSINGEVELKVRGTCPPNVDTREKIKETVGNMCGSLSQWEGDSLDPNTIQCIQGYYEAVLQGRCVYTSGRGR